MATLARIIPTNQTARYEALLRAGRSIATCDDCENAGNELLRHLCEVVAFDYLQVVAFNTQTNAVEWQLLEVNGERLDGLPQDADTPAAWVHQRQQLYLAGDWSREPRFSRHKQFLIEH